MAVPAYGGSIVDDAERRPGPARESAAVVTHPHVEGRTLIHEEPPFGEVVVEEYHSAGAELGMGVAATLVSIAYTPVKFVTGVVGAELGGIEGFFTGGDLRTAKSMWRPTVEGDYYVRPDHLDGAERFEVGNFRPVARERYTVLGRQPVAFEERQTSSTAVYEAHDVDVAPVPAPPDSELEVEDDTSDR
jgi:hypothetical protein